jgi:type I restriction enzyme S subunit
VRKGWEVKTLGEIFEIERGGSPRPIQKYLTEEPNGINWIKIGDTKGVDKYICKTKQKIIPEGARRSRFVKEGDFILSNSMSFGRPYIMKTSGCIHDGWLVLRAKKPNIDQNYLYFVLSSDLIFKQFDNLAAGSTVRNLNIGLVKQVRIPLPPLSEQKQIVSILDEAFEGIAKAKANAEKNLANAREIFETYLENIFANPGNGWEERTLGEVILKTETINPLTSPEKEFIYIDVSSVSNKTFKVETTNVIKGKDAPSRARKSVKTGDVIFATVRPTLRRISLITEGYNNQVCSTGYFVFRTKTILNNALLFHYLFTKSFNDRMGKLQKGASYPAVTDGQVREQTISFPSSLDEQRTIVVKLDELSANTKKLESIYARKIDELEVLKKSILQKAFSGDLIRRAS